MKVKKLFLLLFTFCLTGCGYFKDSDDQITFNIETPSGAPSIGLYKYVSSSKTHVTGDASTIITSMAKETVDVAILPTNAGMQAILNKNVNYKIAATLTFGNLFILSNNTDNNDTIDKDDVVVGFQQNNVPGKLLSYLLNDKTDNLHFVNEASECIASLKKGNGTDLNDVTFSNVKYIMLPEPAVYNALKANPNFSIYKSLNDLFKEKNDGLEIFQASIFVKNSLDKEVVKGFLTSLSLDINELLNNNSLIIETYNKLGDGANSMFACNKDAIIDILKYNGFGLGFKYAYDNMEAINKFISLWGLNANEEVFFK